MLSAHGHGFEKELNLFMKATVLRSSLPVALWQFAHRRNVETGGALRGKFLSVPFDSLSPNTNRKLTETSMTGADVVAPTTASELTRTKRNMNKRSQAIRTAIAVVTRSALCWLTIASSQFLFQQTQAAPLFEEGFNYSTGDLTAWSNSGAYIQVANPGLTYPGLLDTSPSGNLVEITPALAKSRVQTINFTSTPITSGTVYMSFLINCLQIPDPGFQSFLIGMVTNTGELRGSSDAMVVYYKTNGTPDPSVGYQLGIRHNGASVTTPTNILAANSTNFIVMKYTFGGQGKADIFINPNPLDTEPTKPSGTSSNAASVADANVAAVSIKAQQASGQGTWEIDTIRVGTSWADVAPGSSTCYPAGITTGPANQTVTSGLWTTFSVNASGSGPTYQWQVMTNGGSTFDNVSGGMGANSSTYITPVLTTNDDGNQYRCTISVACGGGSTSNSTPATVTVTAAPALTGVLLDDVFALPRTTATDLTTTPTNHSQWFSAGSTSVISLTNLAVNQLNGIAQTNSRTWLTYFTSNSLLPVVHLNAGETLKATLNFSANGILDRTNASLRFGLFNYSAPGAARLTGDIGSSQASAGNVCGYMMSVNFSTTFHTNSSGAFPLIATPLDFRARTNLSSTDLMGSGDTDYAWLGDGGSTEGTPGFVDDRLYTLELSVTRSNANTVGISGTFTGTGMSVSLTEEDISGANFTDFDTFAIRPTSDFTTATNFTFTRLKVEKLVPSPITVPSYSITSEQFVVPNQLQLTWGPTVSGATYWILTNASLDAGLWSTNATVTASGTSASTTLSTSGSQTFYRIVAPSPQ